MSDSYPGSAYGTTAAALTALLLWQAGATFLVSVGILGWQTYSWLRYAVWPPVTVRSVMVLADWHPADIEWIGVQHMLDSVYGSSLVIALFAALTLSLLIVGGLSSSLSDRDRKLADAWREDRWAQERRDRRERAGLRVDVENC